MFISYLDPDVNHGKGCARNWRVAVTSDVTRISRGISSCTWSPIVWDRGIRKELNFLRAAWLALDFDDSLPLSEALDIWQDSTHIIGTTKSHGIKGERFRVVLRFAEPCLNLANYRCTVETLSRRYGGDPAVKDGARFFYPCTEIVSICEEGYDQEIVEAPQATVVRRRTPGTRVMTEFVRKYTSWSKFPPGEYNKHCFMIAKDLCWAGFSEHDTMALILSSPTYQDVSPPMREIARAIQSGFKQAKVELCLKK
jgi:hypothetical protein